MVTLSDRKIEIVRTLVESAPDRIVGGLQRALAATNGDTVLASVKLLVEAEAADRLLRNTVFQPVTRGRSATVTAAARSARRA